MKRLKEVMDRSPEVAPEWPEKFKAIAESPKEFGRMLLEECKVVEEGDLSQDVTRKRLSNMLFNITDGVNCAMKEAGMSGAVFKLVPMK